MNKKIVSVVTLSAFFILICGNVASGQWEQWVHFIPGSNDVDLKVRIENQIAYVDVAITFYTGGYNITSWGTVTKDGYNFSANSEIWRWNGYVIQVVWTARHTYDLGQIESGVNYTFTFRTWLIPVKAIWFVNGATGDLDYDGKVDIEDILIVAMAYGSYPGHPRWDQKADIISDEKIDIDDIIVVAINFGKTL